MSMVRWDPFSDMVPLRDAMSRLVDETLVHSPGWRGQATGPAVDVYQEGDDYIVEAALPGLAPDAVDVSLLGSTLTIRGEYPAAPEGRQYLFREARWGRFERTVTLPSDIDPEQVQPHYEHGLLRLVLPKAHNAKPRRIALTAGKQS